MAFKKEQILFDKQFPFILYETNARQVMIHCHDCLEVNLILEGSGHYLIENRTYPIHPGDIFLIGSEEHHMAIHDADLTMLVFVFPSEFICTNPGETDFLEPFWNRSRFASNQIGPACGTYEQMLLYLRQISQEYAKKEQGWQLMIRARLLLFLASLFREDLSQGAISEKQQNHGYARLRDVVAYIHDHFDREMTLSELAEQAAMGKSYFSSYFTKTMKMRVFDYIEHVRVNHGAMLLKTTDLNVLEIALQSGFHSSAYFNRVFKKIMGMTPKAYQKSKDRTIM